MTPQTDNAPALPTKEDFIAFWRQDGVDDNDVVFGITEDGKRFARWIRPETGDSRVAYG